MNSEIDGRYIELKEALKVHSTNLATSVLNIFFTWFQQSQSELRIAQYNLAQSEHTKENRLKVLRRTHQSALSLKQSLIQELQDILTEKDEYICQLEESLTGKKTIPSSKVTNISLKFYWSFIAEPYRMTPSARSLIDLLS